MFKFDHDTSLSTTRSQGSVIEDSVCSVLGHTRSSWAWAILLLSGHEAGRDNVLGSKDGQRKVTPEEQPKQEQGATKTKSLVKWTQIQELWAHVDGDDVD